MTRTSVIAALAAGLIVGACAPERDIDPTIAPGAPGAEAFWGSGAKQGVGTSYEAYLNGAHSDAAATGVVSRVWFTFANGTITEIMHGLIHEAQVNSVRFAVTGESFADFEDADMSHEMAFVDVDSAGRPRAPAYRITSYDLDGRYTLTKTILTDPGRQAFLVRARLEGEDGLRLHMLVDPAIANSGGGDQARADRDALFAWEDDKYLAIVGDRRFSAVSAGFDGVSDGEADLRDNGVMDWRFASTGGVPGNVTLTARFPALSGGAAEHVVALGFGASEEDARDQAAGAVSADFEETVARYVGEDAHVGWRDYLDGLPALASLYDVSRDRGVLANASALALKVHEDKTYAGALVSSLATPWGATTPAVADEFGYRTIAPLHLYHSATALLALGDEATAREAFNHLPWIQVNTMTPGNRGVTGWFPQEALVDGAPVSAMVSLDQTAAPILLGWRLWRAEALSERALQAAYTSGLRQAADFLVDGGAVALQDNMADIAPPRSQRERWGVREGYSPSTMAALVAGLTIAADIAEMSNDPEAANRYLTAAQRYSNEIERRLFTTTGVFADGDSDGRYFLQTAGEGGPDAKAEKRSIDGGPVLPEDRILDAGFLNLARYGVRSVLSAGIIETLPEIDDAALPAGARLKYEFRFVEAPGVYPGWRRFGHDGYGEDSALGRNYFEDGVHTEGQRGRVWPLLTGERAHYELQLAMADDVLTGSEASRLRRDYVRAMELFANDGLMLPQQVWDEPGANAFGLVPGEGSNAAAPFTWGHAEYVKLLRSIRDGAVWDAYPPVAQRFATR